MCLLCFDRRKEVTLTAGDAQKLIGRCVELLDLCSKVIGQIDPAVGKLIAFAHDYYIAHEPFDKLLLSGRAEPHGRRLR
jgi:hypothetical protein